MSATIRFLIEQLGNDFGLAIPDNQGKSLFLLECRCEFEGFGRASESWDLVWTLTLPQIQRYYLQQIPGTYRREWIALRTNATVPMSFKGHNEIEVTTAAIAFLRAVPKPIVAINADAGANVTNNTARPAQGYSLED